MMADIEDVLIAEKPDAVLVGGDMVFNCNEIKNKNHI